MPNRRRIGYMPSRRFDEKKNVERQKAKRRRLIRAQSGGKSGDAAKLEEWTKPELYALARERQIKGRSKMTKERLIQSLRQTN